MIGNRVGAVGGRHNIEIHVAVDVRRGDIHCSIRGRRDHVGRERLGSAVLVPHDAVVVLGGREDVRIAVAVHVSGVRRPHSVRRSGEYSLVERLAPVVLVPADLVVAERRSHDVHVPVTIDINRKHARGVVRRVGDDVLVQLVVSERVLALVVEPPHRVVVCRRDQHVAVRVAVHIIRDHFVGPARGRRHARAREGL